jgi:outer membrane protein OmpA-like peptidoglycan-associated protein
VARSFACIFALVALALISPGKAGAQALSAEGQKPGLKIEVRELKRDDGGMVTLRFQISNDDPEGRQKNRRVEIVFAKR